MNCLQCSFLHYYHYNYNLFNGLSINVPVLPTFVFPSTFESLASNNSTIWPSSHSCRRSFSLQIITISFNFGKTPFDLTIRCDYLNSNK